MLKKLELKKDTITNLNTEELREIKACADKQKACWENIWTAYHCDVIYTGPPPQ